MKNKIKLPKLSIFFYVCAFLLAIYSIFSFYKSFIYIQSLISYGSLSWSSDWTDIIQYFGVNVLEFLVYMVACIFFGYAIYLLKKPQVEPKQEEIDSIEMNEEEGSSDSLKFNF